MCGRPPSPFSSKARARRGGVSYTLPGEIPTALDKFQPRFEPGCRSPSGSISSTRLLTSCAAFFGG